MRSGKRYEENERGQEKDTKKANTATGKDGRIEYGYKNERSL